MSFDRFLQLLRELEAHRVDRMKKGTIRPIDKADAAALREKFSLED